VTYVVGFAAMYISSFSLIRDELNPYWRTMFRLAGKVIGASIIMGLVLQVTGQITARIFRGLPNWPNLIMLSSSLVFAGITGTLILFCGYLIFRVEEATELLRYIKGRWITRLGSYIN